ncbi:hypothetical protein V1514DRAFT_342751 [Lipomyces japonicus]|uniref:uncharacterized protein n=1 Tax=Lipomyces japonicus TaxID=56871 RepID=UPI0034CEB090
MNEETQETISLIRRQLFQQVPVAQFRFSTDGPEVVDEDKAKYRVVLDPEVQTSLYQTVILQTDQLPPSYVSKILKSLASLTEKFGEELDGSILEIMIDLMMRPSKPLGEPGPVTYFFKTGNDSEESIVLNEARSIISGFGTTGNRTWEAALALGEFLYNQVGYSDTIDINGKTILELGAGSGFVSLLCGKLAAKKVIATDGNEDIVLKMRRNIENNNLSDIVETAIYKWGNSSGTNIGHQLERESRKADYSFDRKVDVILGADIVCKT